MSNTIPDGWKRHEIKDVALPNDRHSFTGGPFGSNLKSEDYTSNGVRIIQLQNIGDGCFKNSYKIYTSPKKADELLSCNIYPNDIILSKMGDPVARATIIPDMNTRYLMASDGIRLAIDKSRFDTTFILNTINSVPFRSQAEISSTGSTRKRIGLTELRRLVFIAPPLPEQQKIAAILSSVDGVIEKIQAQIDKLKDLKTGVMQELLTKGIGENGKPHTEFKNSPVGRIPVGWKTTNLGKVAIDKGLQTGPFGSQLHSYEYVEQGIPVIMPKDMKNNRINPNSVAQITQLKANELSKHKVRKDDILFSRRGDIGRFAIMTQENEGWVCGTGCLKARLTEAVYPPFFASYLTLTPVVEWLNNNAVGQTMLNLNTSILSALPVVLPSFSEQFQIANTIESLDNRIHLSRQKESSLSNAKKALMQDLLTGKVRVNVESEHA